MSKNDERKLQSSGEMKNRNREFSAKHDEPTDANQMRRPEWLPEDDDDWYEPDYCKNDRMYL